jgi:hypothetical protein
VHHLQREFPDRLRFVFRHFPLEEIHPCARAAAIAAEAAGVRTDFWTMHEYLFEHQKQLEGADLKKYTSNWDWMFIDLSETGCHRRSRIVSTEIWIPASAAGSRARRRFT